MRLAILVFGDGAHSESLPAVTPGRGIHTKIYPPFHERSVANRRMWVYICRLFHQAQVRCLDTNCLEYTAQALALQKCSYYGHMACEQTHHLCCLCQDENMKWSIEAERRQSKNTLHQVQRTGMCARNTLKTTNPNNLWAPS